MTASRTMYLIWSTERNMWWKAHKCGYAENIEEAGRYTYEDAVEILEQANMYYKSPQEYMLLAPECN